MASSKAVLKAIKSLIDAGQHEQAAKDAQALTEHDPKNYTGFMFLGFASEKLGQLESAEKALSSALKLKDSDVQALKGLVTLYEKQGATKLDQYHDVTLRLGKVYSEQEDRMQCQNLVDKYEGFAKRHGTPAQYRRALGLILPSSDIYSVLEGRVQHPSLTYKRILESSETEEKRWVESQIGDRRTRLGARIDQVTREVKYEAISKFEVEEKYQQLIDWTIDDTTRHELEEKLLIRAFENLQAVPHEMKPAQRDKVLNTANGMVIIKHPFVFAWNIALEWVDAEDLGDWDVTILREYNAIFPKEGLAKVFQAFLRSKTSPYPVLQASEEDEDEAEPFSEADQLILMTGGLEDCSKSMLAHRIAACIYLALEEYDSAAENARKSQSLYEQAQLDFALNLQDSLDATNLTLANALIRYQSPRHHPEARRLFNSILSRKPTLTAALLGIGLILEEDEDYGEAAKFLKQALERDPSNLRIKLEHAWCSALNQDLENGQRELQSVLDEIQSQKEPNLGMKSEILYRIAYCIWHLNPSATARKDRSGAYRYLIDSMKANPTYAPPYTLLGIYFLDYGKSRQRAKQALQKAFELSTSELVAAEKLARIFARSREWDLVELVAQRVVSSGKARPAPGSKKKAISWPYAALGVVQMTRQQFSQSIVSFQAALRISPEDYHSWVGLGESYHNSGRFVAAARAFQKAESIEHGLPPSESWFAKYMLANVQREVGAYGDAIRAYEEVLSIVEDDYGVLIALLQTCTEYAAVKVSQGLFGQAVDLSQRAIQLGHRIISQKSDSFNLWKSIGDACSVIGRAKLFATDQYLKQGISLLQANLKPDELTILADVDKVQVENILTTNSGSNSDIADQWLQLAILAYKRGIHSSSNDIHAQAVSWYNLGWAEHEAFVSAGPSLLSKGERPARFLKAAVRSFKRAIELESGNSEYWNALGVVTMNLSPKISQHSLVRSLHLNENSARSWTNLGVLYMINNDTQLANEAFTHAQSADPEYASAWVGQGLLAMLLGNVKEARGLFTHAFEIADSSNNPAARHYAFAAFDHLIRNPELSANVQEILQPLFALRQLYVQQPFSEAGNHLLALYAERVGDHDAGSASLEQVCLAAENAFEKSESNEYLARFAQAKADLARLQLNSGSYQAAIDNAETALDLSSEDSLGAAYAERRRQWRLSAHITAGLAYSRLKSVDQSIKMFQAALEESDHAPDIVCMLAQVLWAKGGSTEREAARTQLFNAVEKHPEHVQSVTLLAVIGLLDGDDDVLDAVEDDLKALRMGDKTAVTDKIKVSRVLSSIASCAKDQGGGAAIADAMTGIMLAPGQPQGWLELSHATEHEYASEMALKTARSQIPPLGDLNAYDLATAFAGSGRAEDAMVAKVIAPWLGIDLQVQV